MQDVVLGNNFIDEFKKEVQTVVAERLLDSFEQQKLTNVEMKEAAAFILDAMDPLNTPQEVIEFLKVLSARWSFFEATYTYYQTKIGEHKEKEILGRLSTYIQSFQQN